jgi:hypothetical protein
MRRLYPLSLALLASYSDPPPACTPEPVDTACQPGYVPTFTNVYKNNLEQGCGGLRSGCHGAGNDVRFDSQQVAYDQLLDATRPLVQPGNPSCSELIVRIEGIGEDYQMPPGDPLSASHRCAIIQWVLDGAQP